MKKPTIRTIADLRKILAKDPRTVFGVGVGFNGLDPFYFGDRFGLLQIDDSDIFERRKNSPLHFSLERSIGTDAVQRVRRNVYGLLSHPATQKHLSQFKNFVIFPTKNSDKIIALAKKNGWGILMNSDRTQLRYEDKAAFARFIQRSSLRQYAIPSFVRKINERSYASATRRFGTSSLVFQNPATGGGYGTFFIASPAEFAALYKKYPAKRFKIAPYISGRSLSVVGCITKFGVIAGPLREQIIGNELLTGYPAAWVGNNWDPKHFNQKIRATADRIAQKIGTVLKKEGLVGIFGVDLLLDRMTNKLHILEVNPRFLGSTAYETSRDQQSKKLPFIALHLLELLGISYTIKKSQLMRQARKNAAGAFVILHNTKKRYVRVNVRFRSGVYVVKNNRLQLQRHGESLADLRGKNEFLVRETPRAKRIKFEGRLALIAFPESILRSDGELGDSAKRAISLVRDALTK